MSRWWLVFVLSLVACEPEIDRPILDGGQGMSTGEDPRCPNRIVPSSPCSIERLECPLYQDNVRCTCYSDEWRCLN